MSNTVSKIISDDTLSRIIQVESAGKVRAKASTSSATGLGQFIDDTWLRVLQEHRPDLMRGRSRAQLLDLRFDPVLMIEMLARFTEDNAKVLGAGYTDGDLYLAHFAGVGTARRLLRGDQRAQATTVFSASAARANPSIIPGKTIGQVRAWAATKMAKAGGKNWIAVHYRPSGQTEAKPKDAPVDPHVKGDPQVYAVQEALAQMNYGPGRIDGLWGGRTAGAIAAFLNDRPGSGVTAPTSAKEFAQVYRRLMAEIEIAQASDFKRPIAEARANADLSQVAERAPEVVPVQKGFLAMVWGAVATAFAGVVDAAKWVMGFFADNRDAVDPGMIQKALSYIGLVPSWVWIIAAAAAIAYVAIYLIRPGRDGIVQSVQTGERP